MCFCIWSNLENKKKLFSKSFVELENWKKKVFKKAIFQMESSFKIIHFIFFIFLFLEKYFLKRKTLKTKRAISVYAIYLLSNRDWNVDIYHNSWLIAIFANFAKDHAR